MSYNYYVLIEAGAHFVGVGGYVFLKCKDILEAREYISQYLIENEYFDEIENQDEHNKASADFINNYHKLIKSQIEINDDDLLNLSYGMGYMYFYVKFAGNSYEILGDILNYLHDNWVLSEYYDHFLDNNYPAYDDDDLENDPNNLPQEYFSNISLDEFKRKSLRERLEILIWMHENKNENLFKFIDMIDGSDLFIT